VPVGRMGVWDEPKEASKGQRCFTAVHRMIIYRLDSSANYHVGPIPDVLNLDMF